MLHGCWGLKQGKSWNWFKYLCTYIWKSYDSNPSGWSLEYYSPVMEINQQLKGVHDKIKTGNIKWAIESEIIERIVLTILNLSKTISTHKGNVEMPNFSMVCFLFWNMMYQSLNSNNVYRNISNIFLFAETRHSV